MGIANADAKGVSNATPLSTFVYNSLQYRVGNTEWCSASEL